jgi:hypothetical protein
MQVRGWEVIDGHGFDARVIAWHRRSVVNSQLGTLAFLSVFHVIGGVAIGSAVRGWLRGRFACRSLYLILWGAMFGLLPLVMGVMVFLPTGTVLFLGIQVGILLGTILVVALTPDWFVRAFDLQAMAPVLFGGLFFLVGVGMGVVTYGESPVSALLVGGLFAAVGGLVMVGGLVKVFR